MTRRVLAVAVPLALLSMLYVVLPQLAGLDDTWRRLDRGDPGWLAAALAFEGLSYGSYVVLFRTVLRARGTRLSIALTYEITMAGVAATRVLAAAGAGGLAFTAWALHRAGARRTDAIRDMTTFLVLLYAVFMAALVLFGAGLASGLLSGPAPPALTVVPAIFGASVIVAALTLALVPARLGREWADRHAGASWGRTALRWVALAPATFGVGVRSALRLARDRDPRLLAAPGWWAFDIAVLWACFHAFGGAPPVGVLVMGYFVGMLANVLPFPGGIGGVDGGMIGAFLAFGVDGGLAIVAVLSYRAIAFWLPTVPGILAYTRLRHRFRQEVVQ